MNNTLRNKALLSKGTFTSDNLFGLRNPNGTSCGSILDVSFVVMSETTVIVIERQGSYDHIQSLHTQDARKVYNNYRKDAGFVPCSAHYKGYTKDQFNRITAIACRL